MAQTTLYRERALPEATRQDLQTRACHHGAVWVVDLTSRRVVRGICMLCAPLPGPPQLESRREPTSAG